MVSPRQVWRGRKFCNRDKVDVLLGGDLLTICQQGGRSSRHDLVLVGGDNPPLEVEVGWQFGGSHSSLDGNVRVETMILDMMVSVNDKDRASERCQVGGAWSIQAGNKRGKDGECWNQTSKGINSLELINHNTVYYELLWRNNIRFNDWQTLLKKPLNIWSYKSA